MHAKKVAEAIYSHFIRYDYKLFNTYLFNWESDFFARSQSGYNVEVEIKISRGDFFKDFEKDKHRLFKDVVAKKKFHIISGCAHYGDGDLLRNDYYGKAMFVNNKQLAFDQPIIQDKHRTFYFSRKLPDVWKGRRYTVNDYSSAILKTVRYPEYRAPTSRIKIIPIETIKVPNQFYFACPTDLVKKEEVPDYAGLIYVDEHGCASLIKKAPYMHKRPVDLTADLLHKFHMLWSYKASRQEKIETFKEDSQS
jgi:hypothetical protein